MKRIIYFTAKWCGPCKIVGPIMQELATKYNITKIDIEDDMETASRYGVKAVPTVMVIDEDDIKAVKAVKVGANSKEVYIKMFEG